MSRKKNVTKLRDLGDVRLRIMEHLPTNDLSLIVLKGHLLIEELLYAVLGKSLAAHPISIFDAGLSFYQLVHIAMAVSYEDRLANIWNAIFALNKIRNTLAHDLEAKDLEKDLLAFTRAFVPDHREAEKLVLADPERHLGESIEVICGVLWGIALSDKFPKANASVKAGLSDGGT
jgi:hypothetical protein